MEPRYLADWNRLYMDGSVADALAYATLLWPRFKLVDDMVFLEAMVAELPGLQDAAGTLRSLGGDRTAMERSFNLVEVSEFFAGRTDTLEADVDDLAEILRASWASKLALDFPQRRFVVEVRREELQDPAVRFFQVPA